MLVSMDTQHPWVAIVDNEEPIRRAVQRLLRSADIPARTFASGAELFAALRESLPYCVVLDLHMPEMSGVEVHAKLVGITPRTAVIFVTGHHSSEAHARAMRHQPLAYLHKPMNDRLLLDTISLARAAWQET